MNLVYQLTIIDHSDFGNTRHESYHATSTSARTYRDKYALPPIMAATEECYHTSIESCIEQHEVLCKD